ncbi:hypothetical protein, partial [Marinomonas hwangdonensis]|uniref:hypothetical protein n=1 Tax=Marinomonas hwangdonensis TaxID=1053647 RepID=UPI0019D46AA3
IAHAVRAFFSSQENGQKHHPLKAFPLVTDALAPVSQAQRVSAHRRPRGEALPKCAVARIS